jgi:hypothetical protein
MNPTEHLADTLKMLGKEYGSQYTAEVAASVLSDVGKARLVRTLTGEPPESRLPIYLVQTEKGQVITTLNARPEGYRFRYIDEEGRKHSYMIKGVESEFGPGASPDTHHVIVEQIGG